MIITSNYENTIIEYFKTHEFTTQVIGRGKNAQLFNFIPMGFDIETTTQYRKENGKVVEHYSNMYIWQFQFDDITFIGRTWEQFSNLLNVINRNVCRGLYKTLIFIQNMSYEFQFCAKTLYRLGHSMEVFAREKRKPMKWTVDNNIVFLDSYQLTHLSLEKIAKNYCTTPKLVGDLDYTKIRNSLTPISEEGINAQELQYCINDVVILKEYAEYYFSEYMSKGILPMTQTMIANLSVKDSIRELKCQKEVYYLMKKCYPKNKGQYDYLMSFYTGAYTHGNLLTLFTEHKNNIGVDVASEYPYMMLTKYFPMGKFRRLHDLSKLDKFLENYCCLMEVKFTNIKSKYGITILSRNKVYDVVNGVWDNGRLYKADSVTARVCEVDLKTLSLHYDYDIEILTCIYTERGMLPNYLRLAIANLYSDKSTLKGVKGKEREYLTKKEKLNGQYGSMCVRENDTEVKFFGETWEEVPRDIDFNKLCEKKNKLPQWAIYVTAHARYHILYAISELCKRDTPKHFYYSDTDSIKCKKNKITVSLFQELNQAIEKDNINGYMKELNLHGRHFETIGTWDFEHGLTDKFNRIKVLGSKRYLCEYEKGHIESTIAGLPKKAFLEYCDKNNLEPFEQFTNDGLTMSEEDAQKLGAFYCDEQKTFEVVDYLGNVETVTTDSYVSLIPITFNLEVTSELIRLHTLLKDL